MVVPAIFTVFGAVCAIYLSVAGFMVTALVVTALVLGATLVAGGPLSVPVILFGFVAMQVGYAASLAARILGPHFWRMHVGLAADRDRVLPSKGQADHHSH